MLIKTVPVYSCNDIIYVRIDYVRIDYVPVPIPWARLHFAPANWWIYLFNIQQNELSLQAI